jgi:hypothetical protein
LHGIELHIKTRRGKSYNLLVSNRREFSAICYETLKSPINYLQQQLELPEEVSALRILSDLKFDATDEELSRCRRVVCPDKDLQLFFDDYRSAATLIKCSLEQQVSDEPGNTISTLRTLNIVSKFRMLMSLPHSKYNALKTSLARVIATKPHSADVERLISYYNLLKTPVRYVETQLSV